MFYLVFPFIIKLDIPYMIMIELLGSVKHSKYLFVLKKYALARF